MDWKTMLTYISGSVDEELLLRNGCFRHQVLVRRR